MLIHVQDWNLFVGLMNYNGSYDHWMWLNTTHIRQVWFYRNYRLFYDWLWLAQTYFVVLG